jgi:hypothetical protein
VQAEFGSLDCPVSPEIPVNPLDPLLAPAAWAIPLNSPFAMPMAVIAPLPSGSRVSIKRGISPPLPESAWPAPALAAICSIAVANW